MSPDLQNPSVAGRKSAFDASAAENDKHKNKDWKVFYLACEFISKMKFSNQQFDVLFDVENMCDLLPLVMRHSVGNISRNNWRNFSRDFSYAARINKVNRKSNNIFVLFVSWFYADVFAIIRIEMSLFRRNGILSSGFHFSLNEISSLINNLNNFKSFN